MTFRAQLSVLLVAVLCALAFLVPRASFGETSGELVVDEDSEGSPYAAGELLVTYAPEADTGDKEEAKQNIDAQPDEDTFEELSEVDAELVSLPEVESEPAQEVREESLELAKQTLEEDPNVEAVEYNYLRQAASTPNDPGFSRQYDLSQPGFPEAWDQALGTGVKIAVLDTGVDASHPDLAGKVALQRDFVSNDDVAQDDNNHGTHVAGIAAAVTNNGAGVAGGCPDCGLLAGKVLDSTGKGTTAQVVAGITWATDNGADVINLSLGQATASETEKNAVDRAVSAGVVVVAAAGNTTPTPTGAQFYPAAYPNAIAVSATDSRDEYYVYSNYGDWVDVAAPGVSVFSTFPNGRYNYKSGTSQATPHVAALAGLLLSQGLPAAEIRGRIEDTATDLGTAGYDKRYGYGRINAGAATATTSPPPDSQDTAAPTGSISINAGAAKTRSRSVTLTLEATDPEPGGGVTEMRFSKDGKTWSRWESYASSSSFKLGKKAGTKRVYAQFKDAAGNESDSFRDSIKYAPRKR